MGQDSEDVIRIAIATDGIDQSPDRGELREKLMALLRSAAAMSSNRDRDVTIVIDVLNLKNNLE